MKRYFLLFFVCCFVTSCNRDSNTSSTTSFLKAPSKKNTSSASGIPSNSGSPEDNTNTGADDGSDDPTTGISPSLSDGYDFSSSSISFTPPSSTVPLGSSQPTVSIGQSIKVKVSSQKNTSDFTIEVTDPSSISMTYQIGKLKFTTIADISDKSLIVVAKSYQKKFGNNWYVSIGLFDKNTGGFLVEAGTPLSKELYISNTPYTVRIVSAKKIKIDH